MAIETYGYYLKPCPFCGKEIEFLPDRENPHFKDFAYAIGCQSCYWSMPGDNKNDLVVDVNKRMIPEKTSEYVKVLQKEKAVLLVQAKIKDQEIKNLKKLFNENT